jgi:hypothetical protein
VTARLKLTVADKLHRFLNREGGYGDVPEGHYAIRDPHEPDRVTLWRVKEGKFEPWPIRVRVGPIQDAVKEINRKMRAHEPVTLTEQRSLLAEGWKDQREYFGEARRIIELNPPEAAGRYSNVTICCCFCNRALTDPESIGYGVGSDCRRWLPASYKASLAEGISRIRADVQLMETL